MRNTLLLLIVYLISAQGRRGNPSDKTCIHEWDEEREAVYPLCTCDDEDETPVDFTNTPCPDGSRPDTTTCQCPKGEILVRSKIRGRHFGAPQCSDDSISTDCRCNDDDGTQVDFTRLPCPEGSRPYFPTCTCPEGFEFEK